MNPSYNSQDPSALGSAPTDSTGKLAQAKQSIASTARDTASKVKNTAAETAARAKEQAQQIASQRKEAAADRIGAYGNAMRESARALEEQDPNIAWFTNRAAERIETVANYVRTRDFTGLRQDAENIARRHPAAFFGGMFLAGLVVGNIMKASRAKVAETESEEGFENEEFPTEFAEDPVSTPVSSIPSASM